jgi:hypothetical protein
VAAPAAGGSEILFVVTQFLSWHNLAHLTRAERAIFTAGDGHFFHGRDLFKVPNESIAT